jgi:hypothetical protein
MTRAGFAVAVIAFLALSRWRPKCAARARKRRRKLRRLSLRSGITMAQ